MDRILILDFGSQVTQLIARRLRAMQYHAEIVPFDISIERLDRSIYPAGIQIQNRRWAHYQLSCTTIQPHDACFGLGGTSKTPEYLSRRYQTPI